jgi:cysteine desulfurase
MKEVFLDYASTTPIDPAVLQAITTSFTNEIGNPSSIHHYGRIAREAVETNRAFVARLLGAKTDEIVFTAGGTESNNLAIKGIAYANKDKIKTKGPHIITSAIEHPAVLEPCRYLEDKGFTVQYLPVDKDGLIDLNDLQRSITKGTFLITIMTANNEIGTIQPIHEIGKIAKENNILFHTDAVQAVSKIPIDVKKNNIDLLSLSSHKIYGPKGIGALYARNGLKIIPLIHGGGHEKGLRSSTLNVPGIAGLGKAAELATQRLPTDKEQMTKLRDHLIKRVFAIEESHLNGHPTKRLSNNAHLRFTGIEGESLLLGLDDKGIAASTGSACSSQKLQASHVLLAIGLSPVEAHGSLRFTLGRTTTKEDIDYVADELPGIVNRLRQMSPMWNR